MNSFLIVIRATVLAAHNVDIVETAGGSTDAFQLRNGGNPAVGSLLVFAESEALYLGELDFVGAESGNGFEEGGGGK